MMQPKNFRGAAEHPTHVANGGTLARRYRRNMSGERDIAATRRHGIHAMIRRALRKRLTDIDPVTAALANPGADG